MVALQISPYVPTRDAEWDKVVRNSKNGNFLHLRNYMDYHAERFSDASLVIHRNDKPVGVFPANFSDSQIMSHGGLTYGGLIYTEELSAEEVIRVFEGIGSFYQERNIKNIIYKPIPHIFHRYPCEEDLYALYRVGAKLIRRDASSAIDLQNRVGYSKGRKWSINKAKKSGIKLQRVLDLQEFHDLLSNVLKKFGTAPVHSLDELELLSMRFPREIQIYGAYSNVKLAAAALVFDFDKTVHTQYLAASEVGREIGALDFLLADLIENCYADRRFFSFGISTENSGLVLNSGLIAQKEGFGARTIVHDFYEWIL